MNLLSIAAGAAGVGVLYFLYLVSTRGLPAAWAWLKSKWTASRAAIDAIDQDVAELTTKFASLETSFTLLEGEFTTLKSLLPASVVAPAAPAPAPAPAVSPAPAPTAQPAAPAAPVPAAS